MATQEERLTLLEQNIRDINHNETILLGLAMKQGEHIREVRLNLASLSERVDTFEHNVNSRFDSMDSRFDRLDALLAQVIERLPQ
jgi:septation ring formation regulator EzrA